MTALDASGVRRAALVLGLLLALGYGVQQLPASTSTSAPAGPAVGVNISVVDPLSAPAQSALDAILGPNHAVVTSSATYSQASSRLTSSYNPKQVAPLSQAVATGSGYRSSVTNNGVGQSLTRTDIPAGQVQRLSVAVVLDSALRPAPKLAAIRQTVTAAMGLQVSRGDKLSVVSLPIPAAAASAAGTGPSGLPPTTLTTTLTPYLTTTLGFGVALVLLLLIMMDARARRKRERARAATPAPVPAAAQ